MHPIFQGKSYETVRCVHHARNDEFNDPRVIVNHVPGGENMPSLTLSNEEMREVECTTRAPNHPIAIDHDEHIIHENQDIFHFTDSFGLSERERDEYVEPNASNGDDLTEPFLSQVSARALQCDEGQIQCTQCNEEFGNIASWQRHASRAHRAELTTIRCPICAIEFRNECNMKRHLSTVHKDVPEPFICRHCPASFSSDRARSIHIARIHSNGTSRSELGGIAKRRGRRGTSRALASRHKVHKCSSCDYMSKWKGNISRHVNAVHLDLRPFACDLCDRRFNTASNLSVHKMTHRQGRGKEAPGSAY